MEKLKVGQIIPVYNVNSKAPKFLQNRTLAYELPRSTYEAKKFYISVGLLWRCNFHLNEIDLVGQFTITKIK